MKRIRRFTITYCLLALQLFLLLVDMANADCKKLLPKIKQASDFILGINYPYWYNVGQIETESNCTWKTSLDGWGSIGYAQLTEKFLPWLKEKFPNWKIQGHIDHFMAQAYLIKQLLHQAYCQKLWNVYQCYNRSCWKVNREAQNAECEWRKAFGLCEEKYAENICVWKQGNKCLQWRTSCDINYNYGYKVWRNGIKYREGIIEKTYRYW